MPTDIVTTTMGSTITVTATTTTTSSSEYSDAEIPTGDTGEPQETMTYRYITTLSAGFEPGEKVGETTITVNGTKYLCGVYTVPGDDIRICAALKIPDGEWLLYYSSLV